MAQDARQNVAVEFEQRGKDTVFVAVRAHFRREAAAFKIRILLRLIVDLETLRVPCSVNTLTEFLWRFFFLTTAWK